MNKRMVISVLGVLRGLVIGGFEGMPVIVIGEGIFTVALLLKIVEKSLIWRKIIFSSIIICFEELGPNIIVMDTDGTVYKEAK